MDMTPRTHLLARLAVVVGAVVLYRLGTSIPVPGVDAAQLAEHIARQRFSLWSLFSGGVGAQASLFAMGIGPYITASLLMQIAEPAVPALRRLRDDGIVGAQRRQRTTRTLAFTVLVVQVAGRVWTLSSPGVGVLERNWSMVTAAMFMIAGFAVCLWLTEVVTRRGLGNGLTLLLVTSFASSVGPMVIGTGQQVGWGTAGVIVTVMFAIVVWSSIVTLTVREFPVMTSRQTALTRAGTYPLRIRLLSGGITPIILGISLLTALHRVLAGFPAITDVVNHLRDDRHWSGALSLLVLSSLMGVFYLRLTLDPVDVTNNLQRSSAYVPGVDAGWPTARHIGRTVRWLAWSLPVAYAPLLLAGPAVGVLLGVTTPPVVGVSAALVATAAAEMLRQARAQTRDRKIDQVERYITTARELNPQAR